MFALPVFAPPGTTPNKPLIPGTTVVDLPIAYREKTLRKLAASLGADTLTARYPDPLTFARFLGKVAHAFAVACFGLDACLGTPLLQSLLARDESIFKFVGNDNRLGPFTGTEGQHDIVVAKDETSRIVFIRLLALMRTPEYLVRLDAPGAV